MTDGLQRYRVEDVIGVGSFATVHRAHDHLLDDTVVLKILAENHSLNPEIRERFISEGRSIRRVSSQHVVTVHDIGESERQQPYLVLEHADRGTLRDRVALLRQRGWRASADDVLAFARPLAAALEAVHDAQLVHRDLSPGNLLLTSEASARENDATASDLIAPDERLLVADLGMCKDLALNSGLTVSGGTSGFRPPEQSGPGLVDTRADIWAMSAVLHWLVQGSELPAALHKVLKRGMAPKPHRRQPDAETWLTEVEQALAPPSPERIPEPAAEPELSAPSSSEVSSGSSSRRPGSALRRYLLLSVLVLTLIGGVLLGRWLFGETGTPPFQTEDASISIEGPAELEVGQEAVFTVEAEAVSSWVWTLPSGRYVADEQEVTITATSPGTGELVLRARASGGEDLEVRHAIRVVE